MWLQALQKCHCSLLYLHKNNITWIPTQHCCPLGTTFKRSCQHLKLQKYELEMKAKSRDQGFNARALQAVIFMGFSKTGLMLQYYSVLILSNRSKWSLQLGRAGIWHSLTVGSCEHDVGLCIEVRGKKKKKLMMAPWLFMVLYGSVMESS